MRKAHFTLPFIYFTFSGKMRMVLFLSFSSRDENSFHLYVACGVEAGRAGPRRRGGSDGGVVGGRALGPEDLHPPAPPPPPRFLHRCLHRFWFAFLNLSLN